MYYVLIRIVNIFKYKNNVIYVCNYVINVINVNVINVINVFINVINVNVIMIKCY